MPQCMYNDVTMKIPKKLKRVLIDTAGYIMIILAGLLGWLPGPGGTPLLLGGLALLSIHNEWAQRLRDYLIEQGTSVLDRLFPDHKAIVIIWDIAILFILGFGAYALFGFDGFIRMVVSAVFLAGGLVAFGRNRRRFERLVTRLKRQK